MKTETYVVDKIKVRVITLGNVRLQVSRYGNIFGISLGVGNTLRVLVYEWPFVFEYDRYDHYERQS